jgi:pSer/pThr/pTyr-binding forkhead associated (FHA) protein
MYYIIYIENLGRSRSCNLHCDDLSVSKRHAVIFLDENRQCRIVDIDSKHGTFVNGDKVDSISEILRRFDKRSINISALDDKTAIFDKTYNKSYAQLFSDIFRINYSLEEGEEYTSAASILNANGMYYIFLLCFSHNLINYRENEVGSGFWKHH